MTLVRALPTALDGHHVLVVPRGTDVRALAAAWYPHVAWEREPVAAVAASRPTGARFRGIAVAETAAVDGLLRLDDDTALIGPFAVDGPETGTGAGVVDVYGLQTRPAGGPATAADRRATQWMTAAARRSAGMVASANRQRALVPDPDARPDLTLWSAEPMTAADAVALVRPALSGARLAPSDVPHAHGSGPQPFALTATYEYDGAVTVRLDRGTQPPALAAVDWREHGPWAYRVAWAPLEPAELDVEDPSPLHVIARQRVSPAIARATAALWRAVGGTVLDAGAFVVPADDLRTRATRG